MFWPPPSPPFHPPLTFLLQTRSDDSLFVGKYDDFVFRYRPQPARWHHVALVVGLNHEHPASLGFEHGRKGLAHVVHYSPRGRIRFLDQLLELILGRDHALNLAPWSFVGLLPQARVVDEETLRRAKKVPNELSGTILV